MQVHLSFSQDVKKSIYLYSEKIEQNYPDFVYITKPIQVSLQKNKISIDYIPILIWIIKNALKGEKKKLIEVLTELEININEYLPYYQKSMRSLSISNEYLKNNLRLVGIPYKEVIRYYYCELCPSRHFTADIVI